MTIRLISILLFIGILSQLSAEGTREVAPNGAITVDGSSTTDIAALHLSNPNFNNFAAYDNPDITSRLHIHISDPNIEQILLGFSIGHLNVSDANPTQVDFEYRIKDPNGNIVFGPVSVTTMSDGPGVINSWSQGWNGPQELGNADGYDALEVTSSQLSSQGWTGAGDYYIEFTAVFGDTFLVDFWDITVVDNSTTTIPEKKGRVWSNNWAFFAINDFGFPNRPFNGSFYVCAPDPADPDAAFITRIDFNNSGFQPAAFIIAFNSFGIENTGDIISDRRSFENENRTISEYPIFLNDPVDICKTAELGELTFEGVSRCAVDDFCIKFSSTKAGQVDVLLDFDGQDDIYTPNTSDVLISINVAASEVNTPICIDWNGQDGLGNVLQQSSTTQIPVSVSFAQGIYHFPIYDAELMVNGFDIETVRPSGPKPMLYYDDTMISTPSGSGEPPLQLMGCNLPCHRWTNYTDPGAIGFGNLNTINSWWFSTQSISNEVFLLPAYYSCEITGDDVICDGTEAILNLDLDLLPNGSFPLDIADISWTGPAIIGSNSGDEITVGESGTYESITTYVSTIGDTCSLSCLKSISIQSISESQIDTTINAGEEVSINNITYNADGTYMQTLTATNGCDSILTIIVNVLFTDIELTCEVTGPEGLCVGERADLFVNISYTPSSAPMPEILTISWSGLGIINSNIGDSIRISLPGLYTANIQWVDQMGNIQQSSCSIDVLDNQNKFFLIDTSFFLGDTAIINGETFTESGISEQMFTTAQGCDSTITIVVNVIEPLYECFITGDNIICINETTTLELNTIIIPPGSPIPPISEVTWVGPGISTAGNTIEANQTGTYTATAEWINAIGITRSTECSHDLSVNETSEESITIFIIEGDSIFINGEKYTTEGQYLQSLISNNGCDSLLTINVVEEQAVITYDMEDCKSSDYSLLTATPRSQLECGLITGGNIFRENPNVNAHSCTPGINEGSIAMCVSSLDSCDYVAGHEMSVIFEVQANPIAGEEITISGIDFWEQAPASFQWIAGQSGRNNFPTRYGIRVLKDGIEIYREADIMTSFLWSREIFSFLNDPAFSTDVAAVYRFELLPYCLIGFDAPVTAWDIDNLNVRAACSRDNNRASIQGSLTDNQSRSMSDVDIIMRYGSGDLQTITSQTNKNGDYAFQYLPMYNSYQVSPHKNDDHLNGVSTLDIIHIQRHILGVSHITTAEKMVAADINNSNSITAVDIIELRKLILGIREDFPNNTSWKFSSTDRQLSMDYPWALEEDVTMKLSKNIEQIDFSGIKIGDVNGDASLINKTSTKPVTLSYSISESINGQQSIDFFVNEDTELAGLQIGLRGIEEFIKVDSDLFQVDGQYNYDNGHLNISFSDASIFEISPTQIIFSIVIEVSEQLYTPILSEGLQSELYIGHNLSKRSIILKSETEEKVTTESKWTAVPNPFANETTITYQSDQEGDILFSFYNINGQLLHSQNLIKDNGHYKLTIDKSQIKNSSGIIYCVIRSEEKIESYKLLLIK